MVFPTLQQLRETVTVWDLIMLNFCSMRKAHDRRPAGIRVTSKDTASTLSQLSVSLPTSAYLRVKKRLELAVLNKHSDLPNNTFRKGLLMSFMNDPLIDCGTLLLHTSHETSAFSLSCFGKQKVNCWNNLLAIKYCDACFSTADKNTESSYQCNIIIDMHTRSKA